MKSEVLYLACGLVLPVATKVETLALAFTVSHPGKRMQMVRQSLQNLMASMQLQCIWGHPTQREQLHASRMLLKMSVTCQGVMLQGDPVARIPCHAMQLTCAPLNG